MVYEPKLFNVSGPMHLLTCCDWENASYRRSVAASLVQGVYSLEKDRQQQGQSMEVVSEWWERFQFELIDCLVDESDSSYFGAIYELKNATDPNAPNYVIAFRGTILPSIEDIKLDLKHVFHTLESDSRIQTAFDAVSNKVRSANVWLAGHSLGASIAMLAGRKMVKDKGIHLETFLFNPPFVSVPIERMIKNRKLKRGGRVIGSFLKAGIAKVIDKCRDNDPLQVDSFIVLSKWKPYVFVNPRDPISEKYIGYFEHRERMKEMGVEKIERMATRYTFRSLAYGAFGGDLEPWHIVPTAHMTVNLSPLKNLKHDHELAQWWQQHLQCHGTLYELT